MNNTTSNIEEVLLATDFTVGKYRELLARKDSNCLAEFLYQRFSERYIDLISNDKDKKNGFGMMALCCLMIESLECFHQGLCDTKKKGEGVRVFGDFFKRNSEFHIFQPIHDDFYYNVRCGILHQAETLNGWKIRRDCEVLFDSSSKTIDANKFQSSLKRALQEYKTQLKESNWDSEIWNKFRNKMDCIIKNCKQPLTP